ncbi:hypothetical protein GCM10018787_27220 [Streptomyces thermodiastaticus]|nr:hypothetical protein GCM10018787_27220 [Streptomyces thermodiastaticus]
MHEDERADQRDHHEHIGKDGTHGGGSEPLGEDEGHDEIAQQGDGHDQADDVLGGHSLLTPLATAATSANTATVATTKATSAIASSWMRYGETGTGRGNLLSGRMRPSLDGSHTP